MVTPELLQFIAQENSQGRSAEEIKATLSTAQWSEADIDEALNASELTATSPLHISKPSKPKKPLRYYLLHISLGLLLSGVLVYLFLFIENNYFRHGLDPTQILNGSSIASISPSYAGKLHNELRKNELIELGKVIYIYQHSDGVSGLPSTNGKTVSIDDPSKPLSKAMSFASYIIAPDPFSTNYHYTYESDGMSYEVTCVQTDDIDENKVASLFAIKDGDRLTLDPVTRMPVAQ